MGLEERFPRRKIRDRLNPIEFYDNSEFSHRYRFKKESVIYLNGKVGPAIKHGSERNFAVPPLLQLLVALRFYATGCFQMVDGDLFGVHKSTVCRIVSRVSKAIAGLKNQYIRFEPRRETTAEFYGRAGFPGVIGAIDCTHIPITNPGGENGELFRNRKGYCSINVQVVCDDQAQITHVVARWPGSTHDSRIFDNSQLCALLERGEIRGHLVGDNGYACRPYLMTPLLNPQTQAEKNFNYSHIKTRGVIERVFGVWKRRFPCIQEGLRTKLDTTLTIIVAVAVLYNFGKRVGDELPEEDEHPLEDDLADAQVQNAGNANGNAVRRTLIENHFAA